MDPLQTISQDTINAIKAILGGPGVQFDANGVPVKKDITQATGLVAYNLEPAARVLVPAFSPLRNRVPRVANTKGGTAVNWKVITSLDINKGRIFTAEGTKAGTVSYTVSDRSQAFKTMSAGDNVTFQSQWAGKTFEDVKAKSIARLLKHIVIREEQGQLGGRHDALPAVTAPTVTVTNGGGTIADATYNVFVRAINSMPGTGTTALGRFSTATSTGAVANGGDSSISASTPWVEGATRYEWYVGTAGAEKLEATTRINSVVLTSLAGTGATKAAVVAADVNSSSAATNGGDEYAFNGVLAQVDSSFNIAKTLATGTAGTGTSLALADIDDVLQDMWDTYRADPDVIFVNSQESIRITNLVLAANGAPTLFVTPGTGSQGALTGGYRVSQYLNKTTGKTLAIITHPYLEQGTMLIGSFEMPFPASDIDNVIEFEARQDYMQLDYPVTAPKWEFEVLLDGCIKLFFPGSWAAIRNIAASA